MNDIMTIGAAASPVLSFAWAREAASVRLALAAYPTVDGIGLPACSGGTDAPVGKVDGTGLSAVGGGTHLGASGVAMWTDQAQGTAFVRIQTVDDRGIPPRRTPVRC